MRVILQMYSKRALMWIVKQNPLCILLLFMLSLFGVSASFSETHGETKLWALAVITGPFMDNSKVRYYLQQQINFVDNKYKFHNAFFFTGLGYEFDTGNNIWMLAGYNYIKENSGRIRRLDMFRQQLDWRLTETNDFLINSVTRLEERKDTKEPGWAVRIRERVMLRVPFKNWEKHSLVVFDEVFFDLNHPSWINSNTFFEQNRAFIGIGTTLSKHVFFDVGYMNQYQIRKKNVMSNILFFMLNVV